MSTIYETYIRLYKLATNNYINESAIVYELGSMDFVTTADFKKCFSYYDKKNGRVYYRSIKTVKAIAQIDGINLNTYIRAYNIGDKQENENAWEVVLENRLKEIRHKL